MSPALVAALLSTSALFLAFAIARSLYRVRQSESARAFGRMIAQRYAEDELSPAIGPTGDGRVGRARSAPKAYVEGPS